MSGIPRNRALLSRSGFALTLAAAACAALTACQAPLPIATAADGGALPPTSRHGRPGDGDPRTTAPTSAPTTAPPPQPTNADPDPNCTLIVPPAPLSAAGLATPYRLVATNPRVGACHEADPDQSAFVEAAILDPASRSLAVYHPLVVDDGTQPAIPPVRPALPRGSVVAVWFGFQANDLTLRHHHVRRGLLDLRYRAGDGCVNGTPGSVFGQFAYCGAPQFFTAANAAVRAGKLRVPPLGTGRDGASCPTTRDFGVVDQDQSDNLPGSYLATSDGRTAQFSAANRKALRGATVLNNASDNGLVDNMLDPVLDCRPPTAPDLGAGGTPSPSLALNELQAAAFQAAPIALVPPNDPMTEINGGASTAKTNLYRLGVDQPPLDPATDTAVAYCDHVATIGVARVALDAKFTGSAPSPDPAVAADLHGFLVARLSGSWGNLGCPALTGRATPDAAAAAATTTPPPTTPTTTPTTTPPNSAAAAPATARPTTPATSATPTTTPPAP